MSRTPPPSEDDATLVTEDLDDYSTMFFDAERVGPGAMYCVRIESCHGTLQYNEQNIRYSFFDSKLSGALTPMNEQQDQSTAAVFINSKVLPRYKESFDIWARSKDAEVEETIRAVNELGLPIIENPQAWPHVEKLLFNAP